ncbi:hypothetical protein QE152_g21967 [Popillia japonica]|uniref:Polyprotein n=1 Tax=Popillia japonica TaxID=7064 RepID=A0AAW1KN08_POPJA
MQLFGQSDATSTYGEKKTEPFHHDCLIPSMKWSLSAVGEVYLCDSTMNSRRYLSMPELINAAVGEVYLCDSTMNSRRYLSMPELINVTKLRKEAAQRLERNRLKQDLLFNKKLKAPKMFQIGDLIVTKVTSAPGNHESKKLLPKLRGPFKVVEILPNDRYRVKKEGNTSRSSDPYEAVVGLESLKRFKFHDN